MSPRKGRREGSLVKSAAGSAASRALAPVRPEPRPGSAPRYPTVPSTDAESGLTGGARLAAIGLHPNPEHKDQQRLRAGRALAHSASLPALTTPAKPWAAGPPHGTPTPQDQNQRQDTHAQAGGCRPRAPTRGHQPHTRRVLSAHRRAREARKATSH